MKKIMFLIVLTLITLNLTILSVSAESYNYSPLGEVIYSAEAVSVTHIVDSSNLKDELNQDVSISFGELVDVFAYDNKIYLVDKSNNQVHILNEEYEYLTSFGTGVLLNPSGIFVTEDYIYVADTGNFRIALFDHTFNLSSEILAPSDPTFKQSPDDENGYDFKPLKLTVNRTGRIYVVADQVFEGILDFNPDGTFSRYVGANSITLSLWDAFWLKLTSEEQRAQQGYRLATTFKNLMVDEDGYLYTVSDVTEGEKVIKKLNYKGVDVLSRNGYIPQVGDLVTVPPTVNLPDGPSVFTDIDVNEFGNYMVLDSTRGRIFTYDFEGNLLYIFGELGNLTDSSNNLRDKFIRPTAIKYFNDKILVVDSMNKNLIIFEYTEFGRLVNQATEYYFEGDYDLAKDTWEEVLVLNTNYYLAYKGIAKAELREGNYEKAMEYSKLGFDDDTFSSAYQPYRYEKIAAIFPYILVVVFAVLIYGFIKNAKNAINKAKEEDEIG
ncbi:MAG: hypothetical protein PHF05_05005 [Candidatus Izemoplasmatales bacterium]|nr:hypothetical protein [Candidatus Izemoplasmatales bacterium]MDY0139582.1 hypothetical protein [Candidatus Izemoplasmatales bacterium]